MFANKRKSKAKKYWVERKGDTRISCELRGWGGGGERRGEGETKQEGYVF
jgi:hypothetical protein